MEFGDNSVLLGLGGRVGNVGSYLIPYNKTNYKWSKIQMWKSGTIKVLKENIEEFFYKFVVRRPFE